jgi:hypothetical protein
MWQFAISDPHLFCDLRIWDLLTQFSFQTWNLRKSASTVHHFFPDKCIIHIKFVLKGHGNVADFPRFLHKLVRHRSLALYISSRSDFGLKVSEIFVIEKRHPDSASRGVGESAIECLKEKPPESEIRQLPDSPSRGVVFRLRISPRIQGQNRNGSKGSIRDSWGTDLCKNPRKTASLPCPFNKIFGQTNLHSLCPMVKILADLLLEDWHTPKKCVNLQ